MNRLFIFLQIYLCAIACKEAPHARNTELRFHIENGYNQTFYLEKINTSAGENGRIDSLAIKDRVEDRVLYIRNIEENLYRIRSADNRVDIILINDRPEIYLSADYLESKQFRFENSPASTSLHQFLAQIRTKMESARSRHLTDSAFNIVSDQVQQDYRNYVDTVTSPAAALYVYNAVDFGYNRAALKTFMAKLEKRFVHHSGIQQLVKNTYDYISILEEELSVGDFLPDITLPDSKGSLLSLSIYKGQYLLVDFWASWHPNSISQLDFKKKAYEQFSSRNFSIVSISLDPEIEAWKSFIGSRSYPWPQLIDQKIWMGPAAYTFKFDSIPFNFLVNPEGKIIAKALYGDSLLLKLKSILP
jgi:peroxiredoxin